jgi:hypothetical protein
MIFVERPARRAGRSTKIMETDGLSRAQESMFASEASNPRSGRDIDAEHGSGTADPEGVEWRSVNPVARKTDQAGGIERKPVQSSRATTARRLTCPC